jgi:hypothetical protein
MDGSRESKSNPLASDCIQKVSLHVPEVPATVLNPPPFDGMLIEQRVQLSSKLRMLHWLAVSLGKLLRFYPTHPTGEASDWERMLLRRPFFPSRQFLAPLA